MDGDISLVENNVKTGNKLDSNMVKITSSKSILSYQNGSASNVENVECTAVEEMTVERHLEESSILEETFYENLNVKSECLDILREKLISDWSLTVFSSDLENKLNKMEPVEISKERQSVIKQIVLQITQLSDAEKLLLYLKLPSSTNSPFDPLRQPLNPLGNRQEIQHTIVWIKTHLEEDREISIPKQDVYDQYLKYCENVSMKPLSTADFGKVMKQVYPGVRPRRLGTRGNSRYCYSGMRNTSKLPTPILPQVCFETSNSNGSSSDVESNKNKRFNKIKRKYRSSNYRSDKNEISIQTACRKTDQNTTTFCKHSKRCKVDSKNKTQNVGTKETIVIKKENDSDNAKDEEHTENGFSSLKIEPQLHSDFDIYFKDTNNSTRTGLVVAGQSPLSENVPNGFQKVLKNESCKRIEKQLSISALEYNTSCSRQENLIEGTHVCSNRFVGTVTDIDGKKDNMSDKQKILKGKTRRSSSFSKATKNFKKSYIPIQPKPSKTTKVNFHIESLGSQQLLETKKEPNSLGLCDESDSQEPEEEIARYFKHLDEREMNENGLIEQAVKNIDNDSVQSNNISQVISSDPVPYSNEEDILNQTTQQILRSQSCFEVQRGVFNVEEKNDPSNLPRSQSSVELATSNVVAHHKVVDCETGENGKKKKISHLRVLLEKSIPSRTKNIYPPVKNDSGFSSNGIPLMSHSQNHVSDLCVQSVQTNSNLLISNVKPVNRESLKLNGIKILGKSPNLAPQNLNMRTKYFSFTPISPGPQSPLKTPSTPSASPFVSPRNTPVLRSKQNSNNDYFLSPSERKISSNKPDGCRNEFSIENIFNFSKNFVVDSGVDNRSVEQSCRPRSYSTTNCCRSKTKKNSSKIIGFDRSLSSVPKINIQSVDHSSVSPNPPMCTQQGSLNFVSSDSLSSEVQKFLESNSKLQDGQVPAIRSQSVPLNRMISESAWMPNRISPVHSCYYNSGSHDSSLTSVSGRFSEIMSNSDTNSPKNGASNLSPFVANAEITNLESSPLGGEIFNGVQLSDQYFHSDFQRASDESFSENHSFNEDSTFSNKLELNSNGNFGNNFPSNSDSGIAENIKSYLPDFENLDSKTLVEPSGNEDGVVSADDKLFKNVLYQGGNENLKDPLITSFKPVLINEISSSPSSPTLNFFGSRMNEDSHQLIEFFDFVD